MRKFFAAFLALALPAGAGAMHLEVPLDPNCPPGLCFIYLQVGSPNAQIDTVSFAVPADAVGDGTNIPGNTSVEIAGGFAAPGRNREGLLIADSSSPLTDGAVTIPMTSIGWTVTSGPAFQASSFDGSAAQTLYRFPSAFSDPPLSLGGFISTLNYFYENNQPVAPGTYNGTVVYTLTIP